MIQLILISYLIFTTVLYIKHFLFPAVLLLLPLTDFRSTLFEIIILVMGVAFVFVLFGIGYYARLIYSMKIKRFIVMMHFFLIPILLTDGGFSPLFMKEWRSLFIDLIAEPYRLLTFSYLYSDLIGLFLPFLLMIVGYMVGQLEEKRQEFHRSITSKLLRQRI